MTYLLRPAPAAPDVFSVLREDTLPPEVVGVILTARYLHGTYRGPVIAAGMRWPAIRDAGIDWNKIPVVLDWQAGQSGPEWRNGDASIAMFHEHHLPALRSLGISPVGITIDESAWHLNGELPLTEIAWNTAKCLNSYQLPAYVYEPLILGVDKIINYVQWVKNVAPAWFKAFVLDVNLAEPVSVGWHGKAATIRDACLACGVEFVVAAVAQHRRWNDPPYTTDGYLGSVATFADAAAPLASGDLQTWESWGSQGDFSVPLTRPFLAALQSRLLPREEPEPMPQRTASEWKEAAETATALQRKHDGSVGSGARTGTLLKRWHDHGKTWDEIEAGMWPNPTPTPTPTTGLVMGHWKGNFLDNGDMGGEFAEPWYISTSLAAWPPERRQRYYDYMRGHGMTHVVVCAAISDWGRRPHINRPEFTMGGFDAHGSDAKLDRLVRVLQECRAHGLSPVVSIFEQMELRDWTHAKLVSAARRIVDATHDRVCLYQVAWEHTYALPVSVERRATEDALISGVDWKGRDVGIHYEPPLETLVPGTTLANYKDLQHDRGMSGGITRYRQLQDRVTAANGRYIVRLQQWARGATLDVIRLQTQAAMVVHGHQPGQHRIGGFCAFEFSANIRLSRHSQSLWRQRRDAIMDEVRRAQMPADRSGFLN